MSKIIDLPIGSIIRYNDYIYSYSGKVRSWSYLNGYEDYPFLIEVEGDVGFATSRLLESNVIKTMNYLTPSLQFKKWTFMLLRNVRFVG